MCEEDNHNASRKIRKLTSVLAFFIQQFGYPCYASTNCTKTVVKCSGVTSNGDTRGEILNGVTLACKNSAMMSPLLEKIFWRQICIQENKFLDSNIV